MLPNFVTAISNRELFQMRKGKRDELKREGTRIEWLVKIWHWKIESVQHLKRTNESSKRAIMGLNRQVDEQRNGWTEMSSDGLASKSGS